MMKKLLRFLGSMRFGMILLCLIALLCLAAASAGMSFIYSSWYFISLFVMLGLNLFFCSVIRVFRMKKNRRTIGSFLIHFSMLLLMIAAGCVFTLSRTEDITILPENTCELPDGTVLFLEDFSMENEEGETRYLSSLSAQFPDGASARGEVTVNHPHKFGRYKIYQQSYSYAAVIGVKTEEDPREELVWLEEPAFLSLDGENGIYYSQMFANAVEENGEVKVSGSGEMIHPAYEVRVIDGGRDSTGLVYPGMTVFAGGVSYLFHDPGAYPGLRIKTQPEWTLWLLYLSFAMMLCGLYLCFFNDSKALSENSTGLSVNETKNSSASDAKSGDEMEKEI